MDDDIGYLYVFVLLVGKIKKEYTIIIILYFVCIRQPIVYIYIYVYISDDEDYVNFLV